ncbi:MAG: GlsB/YeaQ/YmgE family stress response membrane protein [Caulobacteraceae bacterium]|nr:GlsB/YeaQ/YmgE family stress response membrane protein [Caulobacteraceae bacterium]
MGILAWIVIGIAAGWLAEQVMGRNHGLLTNLIVGVVGAFLGGFLGSTLFGIGLSGFSWQSLIVAFVGACILLFLLGLVKRRA